MANPAAVLDIFIRANSAQATSTLARTQTALKGLEMQATVSSRRVTAMGAIANQQSRNLEALGRAGKYAALGLGAVAAVGFAKLVKDGVEFNATMESNQLAFKRFIGSAKEAQKFTDRLFETAKRTPFEFTELTTAARRLLSFGISAKQTEEVLAALGDNIAAMGGGTEQIQRATLALGQMAAKGRVSAEELLQLTEAGIPAYAILKEELNLTSEQVRNIGLEGIKSGDAIKALTEGMEERFGGAAKEQARTWAGMTSTLKDNWAQMTGAMTEGLFEEGKKWIPIVNDTMERIAEIFKRDDISFGEKVERAFDVSKQNFKPLTEKLREVFAGDRIGVWLGEALQKAIPMVARNAGQLGKEVVKGLVSGFLATDLLGKLFIGGAFIRMLGGWQLFGTMGQKIGGTVGGGIAGGIKKRLGGLSGGQLLGAAGAGALAAAIIGDIQMKAINDRFEGLTERIRDTFTKAGPRAGRDYIKGVEKQIKLGNVDAALGQQMVEAARQGIARSKEAWRTWRSELERIFKQSDFSDLGQNAREATRRAFTHFDSFLSDLNNTARAKGDKFVNILDRRFGILADSANKKGKDAFDNWDLWLGRTQKSGDRRSAKFSGDVIGNFSRLSRGSLSAVSSLADETNKTLKSLKVKAQIYSPKKLGDRTHNTVGGTGTSGLQTGGHIVPGHAPGDRHTLALNGVPIAKVESGEKIAVVNRKAAAAEMALNASVPRFATGGLAGLDAGAARLASTVVDRFGGSVTSGLRPGDSDSLHSRGLAFDWAGGDWKGASQFANQIGSKLLEGIHNPAQTGASAVSWDSGQRVPSSFWGSGTWAGHMDHIHLATAAAGGFGPVAKKLAKMIIDGPKGPLRDAGQAAVDQAWAAMNKLISSKSQLGAGEFTGHAGGSFDFGELVKLWEAVNGGLGRSDLMAHIALAESGGDPNAHNSSGASGLWQILGRPPGIPGDIFDPEVNARMAGWKLRNQGLGAWAASQGTWGRFMQRGGVVEKLAKGGILGAPFNVLGAKKAKRRKHALKAIREKIRGFGINPYELANMGRFSTLAEQFAEFAGYASDKNQDIPYSIVQEGGVFKLLGANDTELSSFGSAQQAYDAYNKLVDPLMGRYKGFTEAGWLERELEALLTLRNMLIRNEEEVVKQREAISKVIEKTEDARKKAKHQIERLERQRESIQKRLKDARKHPKQNKQLIERLEKDLGRNGDKLGRQRRLFGSLSQILGSERDETGLLGQRVKLNTTRGEILGSGGDLFRGLQTIQGSQGPMHLAANLSQLGEVGGDIHTVLQSLQQIGKLPDISVLDASSTGTDNSELIALQLQQALDALKNANVELAQRPVFTDFYNRYMGMFAKGGFIPSGRWGIAGERGPEVVRGPAQVYSNSDSASMMGGDTYILVEPIEGRAREISREEAARYANLERSRIRRTVGASR